MPAPESPTCQYERTHTTLAHLGAIRPVRTVWQCQEQPTQRVRMHVISAGMGVWVIAETCDYHRAELEQLDQHCWSGQISP